MIASALEVRNLSKHYRNGVYALDDVSLILPARSFTLLTGPSGSGKTTLLAMLASLDRPTSGTVLFAGEDLTRYSDAGLARIRRRIGYVAQDFALISGLPVWENVTCPLIPRGIRRTERRRIAADVLGQVGLGARSTAKPRQLSGGEQQRVAIARALAGKPEVLLADEPTSNLDDETGRIVIALLAEAHAAGATVVVASHDSRMASVATRRVEMVGGRI
jgi:putative ABC transport system ATP-binding protein